MSINKSFTLTKMRLSLCKIIIKVYQCKWYCIIRRISNLFSDWLIIIFIYKYIRTVYPCVGTKMMKSNIGTPIKIKIKMYITWMMKEIFFTRQQKYVTSQINKDTNSYYVKNITPICIYFFGNNKGNFIISPISFFSLFFKRLKY